MAISLYENPLGCSLTSSYTSTDRVVRIVIPPGSLSMDVGGTIRMTLAYRTTLRRMFEEVYFGRASNLSPYHDFDGSQVQVFFNGSPSINDTSGLPIVVDEFSYPALADDYHILSIRTGATLNYIPYQYHSEAWGHRFHAGSSGINSAGDDGFVPYYTGSERWLSLICGIESLNALDKKVPVLRAYGFDLAGRSGESEGVVQSNLPGVTLEAELSFSNMIGEAPFPSINATGWDSDYAPTMQGQAPLPTLSAVCGSFSQDESKSRTPLLKLEASAGHRMSLDGRVAIPVLSARIAPVGELRKNCPVPSLDAFGQALNFGSLELPVPVLKLSARMGSQAGGTAPIPRLSAQGYLSSSAATLNRVVPLPFLQASGDGRSINLSKPVPVPVLSARASQTSFDGSLSEKTPIPTISATMFMNAYNSLDKETPLPKMSASGGFFTPGALEEYVPVLYIQAAASGGVHGFCDKVLRHTR